MEATATPASHNEAQPTEDAAAGAGEQGPYSGRDSDDGYGPRGSAAWLQRQRLQPIYKTYVPWSGTPIPHAASMLEVVHELLSLKNSTGMTRDGFDR